MAKSKEPTDGYRIVYVGPRDTFDFKCPDGTVYSFSKTNPDKLVPAEHAVHMLKHPDIFRPYDLDTLPSGVRLAYERAVNALRSQASHMRPRAYRRHPNSLVLWHELQDVVKQVKELEKRVRKLEGRR